MSEVEMKLRYALAKQIPAMESGFDILTSYGSLHVTEVDAHAVARLLEKRFKQRLSERRSNNNG